MMDHACRRHRDEECTDFILNRTRGGKKFRFMMLTVYVVYSVECISNNL